MMQSTAARRAASGSRPTIATAVSAFASVSAWTCNPVDGSRHRLHAAGFRRLVEGEDAPQHVQGFRAGDRWVLQPGAGTHGRPQERQVAAFALWILEALHLRVLRVLAAVPLQRLLLDGG